MDAKHLSQRLQKVAKYVPQGARMADIGSDHAYLPAYLALQGKIAYAVAGEVVQGPFENAVHEIKSQGLTDTVTARLADGLAAVEQTDHIDTVTIAGMGGNLITRILDTNQQRLAGVTRLVLQPNVGEYGLRRWLMTHNYEIVAEEIVAEDGHVYEIIVAQPVATPVSYTATELLMGPFLRRERNTIFVAKWQEQRAHLAMSVAHMQAASQPPVDKIAAFQEQIKLIEEALA